MALTAIQIKNLRPTDKVQTLSDSGGLQLRCLPSGHRSWRLAYRFDGKQRALPLGTWPAVSLADARQRRDDAKRQLANGIDPAAALAEQEAAEKEAAERASTTFRAVADEYLGKLKAEGRAEVTLYKVSWVLSLAMDDLGDRLVAEIKAPEILVALRRVEARGQRETAKRLRATIGAVMRYAVATGRAEHDPTAVLKGALPKPTVTARPAVTDPEAFGALLRVIWDYDGSAEVRAALQLMALLAQRPGELRQAEWSEFDLDAATWTLPAARMKMRRPHSVPLPPQAIEILKRLREVSRRSRLVFPGQRSADRPISDVTMNAGLRRAGYSKAEACAHGFRASFSTMANESGLWHPDAIERQLAHVEGNKVRAAYARGDHWDERVRMAQWWADRCDELRLGADDQHRTAA